MLRALAAAAALALASRAEADVSLGLEVTLPAQRIQTQRVPGTQEPVHVAGDFGATLLLRAGLLGLGASAEKLSGAGGLDRYGASLLGGLMTDLLPMLRFELLGEVGAANLHHVSDVGRITDDGNHFYGVRPGLSAKLPAFPLRVGVWGLARWGLPDAGSGPSYGALARVGVEF